ncbi:class I adenylate-forming enzyme family protein [Streptomyces sp. TBY4]|uniref:class I adenylate-forming enzyme family protein n=1 Tax=Streptomyces sp. TBY4 TaxID=2962030 RepID=UPI0020B8A931|nr:class I adenylate-forming enzyme family protein [Streptomyces sp. TBY4]MCP3757417.1 acyl--CoA ligase [Streptomyces sp. TBY4]
MLDRLDHALRTRPERPAVLTATRTGATRTAATRGELAELADAFTAALHARGLRPGDTVGVAVRPGPRALAVLLALWRLGLRGAVLDPGAGPDVLRARLASARPALVLADAAAQAVAGWARPLARRAAGLELPELAGWGAPVATVGRRLPGCAPGLDRHAGRGGVPARFTGGGDADAVIVFTSGTTARPRAVVHTRASLAAGMETVAALFSGGPGDAAAATAGPVLGGTFFVLVPALVRGAPVALPARSPRVLARQLARLAPRDTYLTPPQLRDALRAGGRFRGRVWTGSAPASAELLGRVRESGADEAWGVYALTELFPAAAVESREKAAHEGPGDLAGAPLPGVRAAADADGQLLLTGPGARHRYLGEEPDPWVRTGDRGHLDGSGRIVLEGRAKDMVLRRAENIYPGLYEPSLHVPGVELALLVAVPADDGDERLVAVVQPCRGASEGTLRAALDGPLRRMGAAVPDAVLFARIPLAGRSRKPDRAATAALAAARLASGSRPAPGPGPLRKGAPR